MTKEDKLRRDISKLKKKLGIVEGGEREESSVYEPRLLEGDIAVIEAMETYVRVPRAFGNSPGDYSI